jgi:3-deoxy-D-manno-octulosonic-acid transferase
MLQKGAQLRARIGTRPVLLCASTREGEEALILDALAASSASDALTLIVPRHPQRFDDVARMIAARGLTMARRSLIGDAVVPLDVQVLLGDSMGEMFAYYAACDVAFIGGSLLPLGGQNLIEACAVGKPVLIGPHTFNFSAVSEDAIGAGAALRIADAAAMLQEAMCLLRDDAQRVERGELARAFARRHRGATVRTLALLESWASDN